MQQPLLGQKGSRSGWSVGDEIVLEVGGKVRGFTSNGIQVVLCNGFEIEWGYRSFDASSQDVLKPLGDYEPSQPPAHLSSDGLSLHFEHNTAHNVPFSWTKITDTKTQK